MGFKGSFFVATQDVRKERIIEKFRKYACLSHIFVLYYLT